MPAATAAKFSNIHADAMFENSATHQCSRVCQTHQGRQSGRPSVLRESHATNTGGKGVLVGHQHRRHRCATDFARTSQQGRRYADDSGRLWVCRILHLRHTDTAALGHKTIHYRSALRSFQAAVYGHNDNVFPSAGKGKLCCRANHSMCL